MHHSLLDILDRVRERFFTPELEASIIWGRAPRRQHGRKRRSIVFASWWEEKKLIRVHPALDRPWVPDEFMEFLVYHECCHAIEGPLQGRGRKRHVHHPAFRALEHQYPDIERMQKLSRDILEKISREEIESFSAGRKIRLR